MVEGTVDVDKRPTLLERDTNASSFMHEWACRRKKREGEGDERGFAEHLARTGKPGGSRGKESRG